MFYIFAILIIYKYILLSENNYLPTSNNFLFFLRNLPQIILFVKNEQNYQLFDKLISSYFHTFCLLYNYKESFVNIKKCLDKIKK